MDMEAPSLLIVYKSVNRHIQVPKEESKNEKWCTQNVSDALTATQT